MTNTNNERPIEFDEHAVLDVLRERKTQSRRVVKTRSEPKGITPVSMEASMCSGEHEQYKDGRFMWDGEHPEYPYGLKWFVCDYGKQGDLLWVRETFTMNVWGEMVYKADDAGFETRCNGWKAPIVMPRSASRILLRLTDDPYPARVQDIDDSGACKEGFSRRLDFSWRWDELHAQPKPIKKNKRTQYYVSYPFSHNEHAGCRETYRGKPHWIMPNPYVWVLTFEVVR